MDTPKPANVASYCDREDINRLADAGVTLVRLAFHPLEVLGDASAQALARIDAIVGWCAARGVYVVLDLHLPPGNVDIDSLDGAFWSHPRREKDLVRLWTIVATRYAASSAVLGYDLLNEPTPPHPDRWWTLARRLVVAVRKVDSRHIVVLEAPLSGDSALRTMNDAQAVYSFHFYDPMAFSHQGAGWMGDVPPPTGIPYPGDVPRLEEVGWSDGPWSLDRTGAWTRLMSDEVVAPAGAEWLAVVFTAEGAVDRAWFDDLVLTQGGSSIPVPNSGFEEASGQHPDLPRIWRPGADGDGEARWAREGHRGGRSLLLAGVRKRHSWTNWGDAIPALYSPVKPGKPYRLSVWVKTKGNRGTVSAGFGWLRTGRERWDRARLEKALAPWFAWGRDHGVPLYCGEFGATSGHRVGQPTYVADVAAILNAEGVPWTLWTFRDPYPASDVQGMGLYVGQSEGGTRGCTRNERLWETFVRCLK